MTTDWATTSQELSDKFTRNAHDIFDIEDTDTFIDPITNNEETAGGLLAEITRQLKLHNDAPFTYQRLVELADLDEETKKQYVPEKHGAAYLRSVLLLSRVTSSDKAFSDFDEQMDEQMPAGIKLETIPWAQFDEALNPTTFQAETKADEDKDEDEGHDGGDDGDEL